MSNFHKIRLTQAGMETYNGNLAGHEFENGVSVDALPQSISDRLGGLFSCTLILDEKTGEETQAGLPSRMIGGVTIPADPTEELDHATDQELHEELAREALKTGKPPVDKFYTEDELLVVAEKTGITGLRDIAKPWGVKDRNIKKLISEILKIQDKYQVRVAELAVLRAASAKKATEESVAAAKAREDEIAKTARLAGGRQRPEEAIVAKEAAAAAALLAAEKAAKAIADAQTDATPNAIGEDGQPVLANPALVPETEADTKSDVASENSIAEAADVPAQPSSEGEKSQAGETAIPAAEAGRPVDQTSADEASVETEPKV